MVRPNDWAKHSRPARSHAIDWTWEAYSTELGVPQDRLQVGQQLLRDIVTAVEERALPWQPVMNKGYVAIQRPGAYNVLVIDLYHNRVPRLACKLPDHPDQLGLASPYPDLESWWNPGEREWCWTIAHQVPTPDVGALIDLVRPFHPKRGPMAVPFRTDG
ncbi:hypothetical protein [Actinomadura sp. 6N118]|uniref:hypothetical protein n=1 Tax=Actinomadura sp. 6N118 TaxID=3375151 RepID=UPI0037B59C55